MNAPSYLAAFDDGPWVQQELQEASNTWRSEKWPAQSNVLILDRDRSTSTVKTYNDAGISELLRGPVPQIRFILLAPTNQEKVQHLITDHEAAKRYYDNELLDDPAKQVSSQNDGLTHSITGGAQSLQRENAADEKRSVLQRSRVLAQSNIREEPSQLNISRKALLEILTKYDIAPLACSHIRGQEQTFGSRIHRNEKNEIVSFGKSGSLCCDL